MKKVSLTQEEKDKVKEIKVLQQKMAMLKLEYDKKTADFWYDFQRRQGGGAFSLDVPNGIVWKLSSKEIMERQQHQKTKSEK